MKILWIFFFLGGGGVGGSSQNWASLRVISMQFRVFLRSMYRIGIIVFGLLKFQIFFAVLKIP